MTPHETTKDIELIWVSVRRKDENPVFLGVYYGKQESRMQDEMDSLAEEILQIKK